MDSLAYGSRMLSWAPLGKLFFVMTLLITGLLTSSIIVPMITFIIGLSLMIYSTKMKIPKLIGLAIGEAILIMIIGAGMVSIMGSASQPAIWDANILWFHIHITAASFNQAWLILVRAVAGVTLMLAFATSTPIPHLAQALDQIRMPKEITEIIVLIYRYSFLLLERMETMWSAAQCRMGFNGFSRSMHTTAGIVVGIFTSSLEIADKSQSALECRNYQGFFPIFRMPKKITIFWVIIPIIVAVILYILGIYTSGWIDMSNIFFGKVI